MTRFRSLVAYDGTQYFGFQRQRREHVTIQSKLEDALQRVADRHVTVTGAGRTDSGVHASGQVIAFDLDWRHSASELERAINAHLPPDIAVRQMEEAEKGFHPRFDAKRRVYQYRIYNRTDRDPLLRLYSWHVKRPLDIHRMNRVASQLAGQNDFSTFGQPTQGSGTERHLYRCGWQPDGSCLVMEIEANAFLYRMVRSIVGSMKLVGDGSWRIQDFLQAWQAQDRGRAGKTAPPEGLCLVSVTY